MGAALIRILWFGNYRQMEVDSSANVGTVLPATTAGNEEEDPYYAKLGEFYSEWITLKEENDKVQEEEKTFRYARASPLPTHTP